MGQPRTFTPVPAARLAGALALLYVLLCGGYIVLSGEIAARGAATVPELEAAERLKGLAFVATTGLAFFAIAWLLLARVARQQAELARARTILAEAGRRSLAGELAAAVAHDLNNRLAVARGELEELADGPAAPDAKEPLANLRDALGDLGDLARRLVDLGGRSRRVPPEPLSLARLVRSQLALARRHPSLRGCRLEVVTPTSGAVWADPVAVTRALLNLLLNAGHATDGRGHVQVRVLARDGGVAVEVHDDGPGVPPERRERIFQPFHGERAERAEGGGAHSGAGLGLFSVRVAAQEHGGRAEVEASPLGGACFRLWLPPAPAAPEPGEAPPAEAGAR